MTKKTLQKSQKNMVLWLIFALVFVIMLIVIIITTAYFSNQNNVTGSIKLKELDFSIYEDNKSFDDILPSQTINKELTIVNARDAKGKDINNLCSIFFRYTISVFIDGKENQELSNKVYLGFNYSQNYTFNNGVYYYNSVLQPSQKINLCDTLTFSSEIGNDLQNKYFSVIFNVEAIQAENDAYKELWLDAPSTWLQIIENED